MADQFCLDELNIIQDVFELQRRMLSSLSVLHFVFSPVAIFGNVLVIRALWNAASLPTNMKKLFLSLALSDLAVGLFAQLMYAVLLTLTVDGGFHMDLLCPSALTACYFLFLFFASTSLLNLTAISVDRLLAVSLHLRYAEMVTSKRVIIALVATWLTGCISACVFIGFYNSTYIGVPEVILSIGFLLTTVAYFRVYKVARYHRNQIQNQFEQQNMPAINLLREKKSAWNSIYYYVLFLACYLPFFCSEILPAVGIPQKYCAPVQHVCLFLVALNSALNPFLYCWRYREIRGIMKITLKRILRIDRT